MRIGLKDIDPETRVKIEERLLVPQNQFLDENIRWGGLPWKFDWRTMAAGKPFIERKREPTADEKATFELSQRRSGEVIAKAVGSTVTALFAGLSVAGAVHGMGASDGLTIVGGLMTWLGGAGLGGVWASRATPKSRLAFAMHPEEMRAVFPLLKLSRAERIYCDALLLLARTETTAETERNFRNLLQQLNDLMRNARQLEAQKQSLLPIMGMHSIVQLEAEYGELGRRLDSLSDLVSRQALEQSLAMCAARLQNAKTLKQSLERISAQQEAINQTLASALSAMARIQVAPSMKSDTIAEEIAESVSQMNLQTYAVEQAVEEVMTLRTS